MTAQYLVFLLKLILMKKDNICALATGSGMGSIAIIRVSGPDAISICEPLFKSAKEGKSLKSKKPHHTLGYFYGRYPSY